jgi:hypothetical protein
MPKKVDNYTEERKEILQKMLDILGITATNKMFSLKELDKNEQKQKAILELESEVKKYFICSSWNYFANKNRDFKRSYLSLIKSVMKNLNIKIISSKLVKKIDANTNEYETFYIINI